MKHNIRITAQENIRYLLVDDDMDWLHLIKDLSDNPALAICLDPKDALELLDSGPVELLITDTNMGAMSGIDLLREVRAKPRWNHISVLVLFSGLTGQKIERKDILKMGATMVLSKEEFLKYWPHILQS